jgi:hypothetical protein
MQTLNVGAGRTDKEYKEAEEQRRADLRADSRSDANYFFWAAGLAALASGLLPMGLLTVRINILVNIGAFDLLGFYGRRLVEGHPLVVDGVVGAWIMTLVGLGFAARAGQRWAFMFGMVLYGANMIALVTMFSLWAFRGACFLCVQMVSKAKSAERSERSGCLDFLKAVEDGIEDEGERIALYIG